MCTTAGDGKRSIIWKIEYAIVAIDKAKASITDTERMMREQTPSERMQAYWKECAVSISKRAEDSIKTLVELRDHLDTEDERRHAEQEIERIRSNFVHHASAINYRWIDIFGPTIGLSDDAMVRITHGDTLT